MTEIKQYAPNDIITMVPFAGRHHVIRQRPDGTYITGLTQEQEKRLGKVYGKDLSPHGKEFWDGYPIKFYMPQRTMFVDEKTPEGEIFLAVAQANKLLAKDEDALLEDMELKNNTLFYIYDIKKIEEAKATFTRLKDEVSQIIYNMSNDRDRMLFILFKLGKYVTDQLPTSSLYNMLSSHKEKFKKKEPLEEFRKLLKSDAVELQSFYYTKQAVKFGVISYDGDTKLWRFNDKALGSTESKVVEFLSKKENEGFLAEIINEIKDRAV